MFCSVASVSCSPTSRFACLCVRLFLAVGQLNLLGLELQPNPQRGLTACDVLLKDLMVILWYTQNAFAPADCFLYFLCRHFEWTQNCEPHLYKCLKFNTYFIYFIFVVGRGYWDTNKLFEYGTARKKIILEIIPSNNPFLS